MASRDSKQLPEPRFIVTGHAPGGTSVFTVDERRQLFSPFGPLGPQFTTFHTTSTVPASNTEFYSEPINELSACPPGGALFRVADIQPGSGVPMHRTLTLDYIVILSGEIVLELDSGEEKIVGAGEVIVQRGTNHAWHNRAEAPCRILVAAIGSEKIILDGKELEAT